MLILVMERCGGCVCVIICTELAIEVRFDEDVDHVFCTGFSIGRRRVNFCVQSSSRAM